MAEELITRACGHTFAFAPKGDGYDGARRDKWRRTNCRECGKIANDEHNRAQTMAANVPKIAKGSEVKALPIGTVIVMTRKEDGVWHGVLSAEEVQVEAVTAGLMGLASKLARKWLATRGRKLTGRVAE